MSNVAYRLQKRSLADDRKLFSAMVEADYDGTNTSSLSAFVNLSFPVPPNITNDLRIPLYVTIFALSIVGNSLVIVTLVQNRKMRTVTNVFLLNLAISDLLLSSFCMPFTLVPYIMRTFVFGRVVCTIVRYCQSISAAVSCFTLVAISLERYFAICRPLRSRRWQTLSHSYKTIAACWVAAAVIMLPVAVYSTIKTHTIGGAAVYMCCEVWRNKMWEKGYAIVLDVVLLVIPLGIMCGCYGSVVERMWKSMRIKDKEPKYVGDDTISGEDEVESTLTGDALSRPTQAGQSPPVTRMRTNYSRVMTSKKTSKLNAAKRRVIAMLFMVVLEYFICWTPLHILITWKAFDNLHLVHHVTPLAMSLVYLLAYTSSCCNPITYCFMNKNFRQGFVAAFSCTARCVYQPRRYQITFSVNARKSNGMRYTSGRILTPKF